MNEYVNPFFCCYILRLGGLKEMKLFYECLRMYEQVWRWKSFSLVGWKPEQLNFGMMPFPENVYYRGSSFYVAA